jgi:hypothetical protein
MQALRELLDNPERDDWDELLAANRALIKAIETGEPMTRRNAASSPNIFVRPESGRVDGRFVFRLGGKIPSRISRVRPSQR